MSKVHQADNLLYKCHLVLCMAVGQAFDGHSEALIQYASVDLQKDTI